jgi:general secretion pathway protein D
MYAPRTSTTLALVTALALIGCKSKSAEPAAPKAADKASPAAKADPGKTAPAAKEDAGKAAPAAKTDAAKAAPGAGAKPASAPTTDTRLADYAKDVQVREQKRRQLVEEFAKLGDQAFADSRFDEAKKFFGEALELDPKNDHARRRLAQIGAITGDAGMGAREAFDSAQETRRVQAQQAQVDVASLVAQAQGREKTGDYEGAVDLYDRALVIVRLWPDNVEFQPNEAGLVAMKSAAKGTAAAAAEAKRARTVREADERARLEAARQRQDKQNRLKALLQAANQAMDDGQYQQARNLAEEVLRVDPTSANARKLRALAVGAANDELDEKGKATLIDEWKFTFEQLAEATTPQVDDYTFPSTWGSLQGLRKPPTLSASDAVVEDPRDREVRARLDAARTAPNFESTKIEDAISYLGRISGTNIVILPAAKEGKSEEDLTIQALKLESDVPVSKILELITKLHSLAWTVQDGVVQITTPDAARGPLVVQLYDVKDIATPIENFPGEDINLDPTGELTVAEEAPEAIAQFQVEQVQELIQQNVDRQVWESGGEIGTIPPGTLVVKAPRETHAKVQQLLSGLRGAGGLQITIETRFVTVSDNFLQDIGVDLRGLGDQSGGVGVPGKGGVQTGTTVTPVTFDDVLFGSAGTPAGIGTGADLGVFYNLNSDGDIRARMENLYDVALGKEGVLTALGGLSFQGTLIDDTQLEVILRAVEKSDRSTVVLAPKLTAYAGQRANITVLNQVSYISDFDVEIAQAAQIGDPIVQTLRDGVILDLRPVVTADRRFITMELRPTIAILTRPIATFQTTLANGPPVTIQLPELKIQRVRTTVTMPDGGTLLLGGLKFFEERRLESTVPWLGDVPIVSFFLSRKGTYTEKRNLLVLIRARIVRPEENEPAAAR